MTTCEPPLFGCCGLPVGGRWVVKHTVTRLATAVILLLLATPLSATAQPTGKVYRIGFIPTGAPNEAEHLIKALDEDLRELGYIEGRNIVFERRFAGGKQQAAERGRWALNVS